MDSIERKPIDTSFLCTCETLHKIYKRHREAILERTLRQIWPHGALFTDATSLCWVDIVYHNGADDATDKRVTLDTDYAPVPWVSMSALVNIGAAQLGIGTTLHPFLLDWGDFGEDDTLDIHCCEAGDFESIFAMGKDSMLWHMLDEFDGDGEDQDSEDEHQFFIGIIRYDTVEFIGAHDHDHIPNAYVLRDMIRKYMSDGYTPMIAQRSEEDDDTATVVWLYDNLYGSKWLVRCVRDRL